jgi:high affinity Mn2+ porin
MRGSRSKSRVHVGGAVLSCLVIAGSARAAYAQLAPVASSENAVAVAPSPANERFSVHGQSTFVEQYHPAFHSAYTGPLSLDPGSDADETLSVSLFLGARLGRGAEVYVDPEMLQGFGLSNTTGIAGFTNGEAFKVGTKYPVFKLSRLFVRQTFALDGETEALEATQNQLGGRRPTDRIAVTVGKYAVVDIFDDNTYAHDSRAAFLNWTINDLGAFDMASPAFNYTYGASVEWYQGRWATRAGLFLEPTHPNSVDIDTSFRQFQPLMELEERHRPMGRPGKVKLLLFGKRVVAGGFTEALAASQGTGQTPSTALVRDALVWGYGGGLNLEQQITAHLGVFFRASLQSGRYEEFAFTQVEEAASVGFAESGGAWGRENDAAGLGLIANGIFQRERAYLAAGGTGIIIGDGALDYGPEEAVEIYYKLAPWDWVAITADYQLVDHPGYNRDRGAVSVLGARVHVEF